MLSQEDIRADRWWTKMTGMTGKDWSDEFSLEPRFGVMSRDFSIGFSHSGKEHDNNIQ